MPAPTTNQEPTLDDTDEIRRIRDAVHALDENQPNHRRRWWVAIVAAAILTALFAATSLGQASHWARYITNNNLRIAWAVGLIVLFHLVLTYTRQLGPSRDHHEQRQRLSALENSIEGLRTNQRVAFDAVNVALQQVAGEVRGAVDRIDRVESALAAQPNSATPRPRRPRRRKSHRGPDEVPRHGLDGEMIDCARRISLKIVPPPRDDAG